MPKVISSADWTLALNLLSSSNQRRGTLTMHRLYGSRDLQLDINLLTSAFPTALADALDRTLSHSPQVIPLSEDQPSLVRSPGRIVQSTLPFSPESAGLYKFQDMREVYFRKGPRLQACRSSVDAQPFASHTHSAMHRPWQSRKGLGESVSVLTASR